MKRIFYTTVIPLVALTACSSPEKEQLYDLSYIPVYSEINGFYTYFDLSTGKKAEDAKRYEAASYFSDGIAAVSDENDEDKFYFIDSKFKPISNEKYCDATFFHNGYAWTAKENGPITAIKKDGAIAFTLPEAYKAVAFNDGVSVFKVRIDNSYYNWSGLVNTSGKILIKPDKFVELGPYGHNKMIKAGILRDNKLRYGIIDYEGNEIIPFEYEDIVFTAITAKNKAFPVRKNEKWGVVNLKNDEIIEPLYSKIRPQKNGNYIVKTSYHNVGYISNTGEELISSTFWEISDFTYGDHTFAIRERNDEVLAGLIDETGKFIFRLTFDQARQIKKYGIPIRQFDETGLAVFKKDKKYGLLDLDGNTIISNKYDKIYYVGEDLYMIRLNRNDGLINKKGKTIISSTGEYSPMEPPQKELDDRDPVECHKVVIIDPTDYFK